MLLTRVSRPLTRTSLPLRASLVLSTLTNNSHIYIFPTHGTYTLSLLPTNPPTSSLALGTSTSNPPTPSTFTSNKSFLSILDTVLAKHAASDPSVQAQAAAYASTAGAGLTHPSPSNSDNKRARHAHKHSSTDPAAGSGAANTQGGAGGAGRGGWIHVSDLRNPPDYGRIAWPEDIFGSLEVDGSGELIDGHGNWQPSGTYRILTNEGVLGLTDFLRKKVVETLKEMEAKERS